MDDTSGFYFKDGDTLIFGPNWVTGPGIELHRETKDEQTYPVEGWSWFDSQEEAYAFFGLPVPAPVDAPGPWPQPLE